MSDAEESEGSCLLFSSPITHHPSFISSQSPGSAPPGQSSRVHPRASPEIPARAAVWGVIGLNIVWALDSVVLLFTGWVEPNALGYAFILGQALFVAVLTELEYIGLRRSTALAA